MPLTGSHANLQPLDAAALLLQVDQDKLPCAEAQQQGGIGQPRAGTFQQVQLKALRPWRTICCRRCRFLQRRVNNDAEYDMSGSEHIARHC